MNFALLWIDALVVSLLWVATTAAFAGPIKRRWMRGLLVPVVVGVPLFFLGTFVFAATVTKVTTTFEPNRFGFSVSLLVAYLVGASIILRQGRRREPGMALASASWRRGPLLAAMLTAVVVGYMTLLNMDLAIRARCALLSVEVNSVYLATLPAITSDSQNAAPLYEKAFSWLKDARAQEEAVTNPPTGNGEVFDPKEPATITFLHDQAGTIALLRKAAALPACRFDQDLMDPSIDSSMISNLNEERNLANVLNLDAREELAHGNVASAMLDADAILRMSRHFGQRPMIVSNMVAVGIANLGVKTLELALSLVKSKEELASLNLAELTSIGRMHQQSLRGEERFGLALYGKMPSSMKHVDNQMKDPGIMPVGSEGELGVVYRVFFLNPDSYIQLMENLQKFAAEPYYESRPQLEAAYGLPLGNDMLTAIVLPSLRRYAETCARAEAGDACAQTAVATTRYRLDHGSLPTHLADLVPAYLESVPLDPFDGKPLRLAIKGDQWIIYSVGPDLIDHGGVEGTWKKPGDETFTLTIAKPH